MRMRSFKEESKLDAVSIACLKTLQQKKLYAIISRGIDLVANSNLYQFHSPINLRFEGIIGFITITSKFDETSFGDDIHQLTIRHESDPAEIKRHKNGGLQAPFTSLMLPENFIIEDIEIWGEQYEIISPGTDNNSDSHWKIQRNNAGTDFVLTVDSEDKLVLKSFDGKSLIIFPESVIWLCVTTDQDIIETTLNNKNCKLKFRLGELSDEQS